MQTKHLQQALATILPILERRPTLPALERVLLECAGEGTISLTATNLTTYATATLSHKGPAMAGAILPKFLLAASEIAKTTGETEIEAEQDVEPVENSAAAPVVLRVGEWAIPADRRPKKECPLPPDVQGETKPVGEKLFEAVRQTLPFASNDETRYIITGVHLDPVSELEGTRGHVVATDGRRITAAACEIPFEGTLPKPAASLIANCGATSGTSRGTCESHGSKTAAFELTTTWGTLTIATKLLGASYPDWTRVIPAGNPLKTSRWDSANLLEELGAILPLGEKALLEISPEGTGIKILDSNIQGATKTIWTAGGKITCALNLTFAKSLCGLFPHGAEVFHFPNEQPLVVKQSGVTHAMMPMRQP